MTVSAKWHLISSKGFSRAHECDRRHTYVHTYKRTEHDTETSVVVGGIAFSDAA